MKLISLKVEETSLRYRIIFRFEGKDLAVDLYKKTNVTHIARAFTTFVKEIRQMK